MTLISVMTVVTISYNSEPFNGKHTYLLKVSFPNFEEPPMCYQEQQIVTGNSVTKKLKSVYNKKSDQFSDKIN